MTERYEIRPVALTPNAARFATHAEVLAAVKATAKQIGVVPKLPAGKRGEHWRAAIDGLIVEGGTKNVDGETRETYWITGRVDHGTLLVFAQHIAALAGNQAIVGDADDEVWLVDPPKPRTKKKRKRS